MQCENHFKCFAKFNSIYICLNGGYFGNIVQYLFSVVCCVWLCVCARGACSKAPDKLDYLLDYT